MARSLSHVLGAAVAAVASLAAADAAALDACPASPAMAPSEVAADAAGARRRAEALVKEADMDARCVAASYEAGADLYLAIWKRHAEKACEGKQASCERAEELLDAAARAYRAARLVPKAIEVYGILIDPRFNLHNTPLATRARYEIAALHHSLASYDQAATAYEAFALRHPGADRAPDALKDALVIRLTLSDDARAEADVHAFLKRYGSSKPRDSAALSFAFAAHAVEREEHALAKKRFQDLMPTIDRSGTIDVRIQAHALLGRTLAKLGKAKEAAAEHARVRELFRDPAKVIQEIQRDPDERTDRRIGKALTAVGEAMVFAAEEKAKAADAMKPPAYRGAASREEILHHMGNAVVPWIAARRAAVAEAERAFVEVAGIPPLPPPKWVLASAGRVAEMRSRLAEAIASLPAPAGWGKRGKAPGGESWESVQGTWKLARERAAEDPRLRAKAAHVKALELSVKWMWSDAGSRASADWLSRHYPAEYPPLDEIAGKPAHRANGLETAPLPEPVHR